MSDYYGQEKEVFFGWEGGHFRRHGYGVVVLLGGEMLLLAPAGDVEFLMSKI